MTSHNPMTQEQLDAIQEREAKATAGPWAHWAGREQWANCIKSDTDEGMYTVAEVVSEASDAKFISRAREDIPALLAEVERLRAENERLRALTTVDDDMVERGVRAFYEHQFGFRTDWDRLTKASPDVADNYRRHMTAALNAALGTGEGS